MTPRSAGFSIRAAVQLFTGGIRYGFAFFEALALPELLSRTASRKSALKATSSTFAPSGISIARRVFPSRLELNRRLGSFSDAPFANVSFTAFLYVSPVQTMPSCDQTGISHFHSSTTFGSAFLMSLRILARVSPRQSSSSAILFEMSSDADGPSLAPDFFMLLRHRGQLLDRRRHRAY